MIQFLIVGDIGIWHFHVMWSISLICKAACFVVIWVFSARPSFLFSGIFDEDYMRPILDESFLALLQPDDLIKWKDDKGKTVNESIREHALEYIGKPIQKVIRQVSRLCACVSPRLFREFKQWCTLPPYPPPITAEVQPWIKICLGCAWDVHWFSCPTLRFMPLSLVSVSFSAA